MTGIARILHTQQVHFFRKRVTFADAGIASGVIFGTLPKGAMITSAKCKLITAFNAGSTNVLTVGTDASFLNLIAAADVTEATPALYSGAETNAGFYADLTVDTDVGVKYTQTGTPATTGVADISVSYIPNTDQ